jgi:hypothetical protein
VSHADAAYVQRNLPQRKKTKREKKVGTLPACDFWTVKKEKKIFLIYKEIQKGLGAKSYMRKGFLI